MDMSQLILVRFKYTFDGIRIGCLSSTEISYVTKILQGSVSISVSETITH